MVATQNTSEGFWIELSLFLLILCLLAPVSGRADTPIGGDSDNDTVPFTGFVDVPSAQPVLNEHCVVSILNRTAQVRPDGTWQVPNVPTNFGLVRARATCGVDRVTHAVTVS